MPGTQLKIFWPLRLVAIATVVLPALAFVYTTWENSRLIDAQAIERQERALDVLTEHALNTLQTVERALSEINEVLRGLTENQIKGSEGELHLRLKRTQQALPQVQSIWAFGVDGRALVASANYPVPANLDNSDRQYFIEQRAADSGTYISSVMRSRVGGMYLFSLSSRRDGPVAGTFAGIIAVTVMPDFFSQFYRKISRGSDTFALVREDGRFLARYPDVPFDENSRAVQLVDLIKKGQHAGTFIGRSQFERIERRVAYRKIANMPVYVTTGIETASLSRALWHTALWQLAIGVPVVLAVFFLAIYALRRAQRFEEESARREVAENALKQAQRLEAIGQLTGGVAHDFNNLLMVIDGNVGRIKKHAAENATVTRAVGSIETAVARGAALTRQLLSFSRRQTHEAVIIDLRQRLPVIREMLQSSLRGDIAIEIGLDPHLWRTKVDATELELALLNLAVNARDAMPRGGTLKLGARNITLDARTSGDLRGDFVVISVADTGTGIPDDVLGRVFDPFFTTKEVGKGTGLGLSQVYGFATQAGGTATIETKPGVGTTVSLLLPRATGAAQTEEGMPEVPAADGKQSGRVLLVEDNRDVAAVTGGLLEDFGYTVRHCLDVVSAQDALREGGDGYEFVLSDIVMPGTLNGRDLAMWIRERFGRDLPVILMTGYSESTQAAADAGLPILRKPFSTADLRKAIDERHTRQTA